MTRTRQRFVDGTVLELDTDPLMEAIGGGLVELAERIVAEAEPPDAEPFGEGLVTSGGVVAFVLGDQLAGVDLEAPQLDTPADGVGIAIGFGHPGMFQELGTVHHPPQPFLGPAAERVLTGSDVQTTLARRIR